MSIAGNGKPLYDYMSGYFGDQMAAELNVQSKHSAEKAAAHAADCFTTVSGITDRECGQLLEKKADIVTPNGFESGFVPKGAKLVSARRAARKALCCVTEALLGSPVGDGTFFIAISGRYEYKNKGIDLYLDVLNRLSRIEGQLRGIRGMIDSDAYCIDIMMQIAAVRAALASFGGVLMSDHLRTCVADDLKSGSTDKVEELITAFQRYIK